MKEAREREVEAMGREGEAMVGTAEVCEREGGDKAKRGRRKFLPSAAMEVAEIIGDENTVRLMEAFPPDRSMGKRGMENSGRYIYIPLKKSKSKHAQKIEKTIGEKAMQKLIGHYGGSRIYISNAHEYLINYRISSIVELRRFGLSAASIATFYGLSPSYVFRLTKCVNRKGGEA